MTNAGFEVSNETIAILFGSGGFLLSFLTQIVTNRFSKRHQYDESIIYKTSAERNEEQHKEFYSRIQALEKAQGVNESRIESVADQLDRIEAMLTKIIEHIVNQKQ